MIFSSLRQGLQFCISIKNSVFVVHSFMGVSWTDGFTLLCLKCAFIRNAILGVSLDTSVYKRVLKNYLYYTTSQRRTTQFSVNVHFYRNRAAGFPNLLILKYYRRPQIRNSVWRPVIVSNWWISSVPPENAGALSENKLLLSPSTSFPF